VRCEQYAGAIPIKLRLSCNHLTVTEIDTANIVSNLYLQLLQESFYMYSIFNDFKEKEI
jgi:hypothetical protein